MTTRIERSPAVRTSIFTPSNLYIHKSTGNKPNLTSIMSTQTAQVSHLGGITISYRTTQHDDSKPTLVLLHSFMTSLGLYKAQFESLKVTSAANLIAVDLLGHGDTRVNSGVEQFTYWDSKLHPRSRALGRSLSPHTDESRDSCNHDIATS